MLLSLIRPPTATHSTADIFNARHWFHVGGIHAAPDTTQMVKNQTVWNGPDVLLIENPMGANLSPAIEPRDYSVPSVVDSALPNPAWRLISTIFDYVVSSAAVLTGLPALMPLNPADVLPSNLAVFMARGLGKGRNATATTEAFTRGIGQRQPRSIIRESLRHRTRSAPLRVVGNLSIAINAGVRIGGHRSGPFAMVSLPWLFTQRRGFSFPNYTIFRAMKPKMGVV